MTCRRTSSISTPTTRAATSSPTATRSRRRTSSAWPTRACCSARRSAAAPVCSGSRAALLTGEYSHTNGMLGLAHRGYRLADYDHHLVHTLRGAGYTSVLIGEQHLSSDPRRHRLRPRRRDRLHARRRRRARRRRACSREGVDQPFFLSRRLLRDPPRLLRADLGARRALLAAAGQPARHAADPARHGRLQGQRALARPGRRRRAERARRARPGRGHAGHPHHRPRARVPGREGDADRPRHRRAADRARAGRLPRRPRVGRARLPARPVPDDLRAGRASSAPDWVRGPLAAAARAPGGRRGQRRGVRARSPSTPPTNRSARCARGATSTSGASTNGHDGPVLANIDDSPTKDLLLAHGLAERARGRGAALRPGLRPAGGGQPGRRPGLRRRAGASCASGSSAGWRRRTTRCSTARSSPRRARELNHPAQRSPADPTIVVRADETGVVLQTQDDAPAGAARPTGRAASGLRAGRRAGGPGRAAARPARARVRRRARLGGLGGHPRGAVGRATRSTGCARPTPPARPCSASASAPRSLAAALGGRVRRLPRAARSAGCRSRARTGARHRAGPVAGLARGRHRPAAAGLRARPQRRSACRRSATAATSPCSSTPRSPPRIVAGWARGRGRPARRGSIRAALLAGHGRARRRPPPQAAYAAVRRVRRPRGPGAALAFRG